MELRPSLNRKLIVVELLSYHNSYSYIWIKYYSKVEFDKKEIACRIITIQTMGNDLFMHHVLLELVLAGESSLWIR